MLIFKEIQLLPEIFLGISIIYLIIHGTFVSVNTKCLSIRSSILYLSVLIISLFCFLLLTNNVEYHNFKIFNSTITVDFLSFSSKIWIAVMAIFCLLMIQRYICVQKINYSECSALILFSFLRLLYFIRRVRQTEAYLTCYSWALVLFAVINPIFEPNITLCAFEFPSEIPQGMEVVQPFHITLAEHDGTWLEISFLEEDHVDRRAIVNWLGIHCHWNPEENAYTCDNAPDKAKTCIGLAFPLVNYKTYATVWTQENGQRVYEMMPLGQ